MGLSLTLLIALFTALISYQGFSRYEVIDRLRHSPYRESTAREYYRLLTSGFVHADWTHLLVNMFVFYSFGEYIENYIIQDFGPTQGRIIFVVFYLLNIILANLPTAFRHRHNPGFSSIGASGAVSGFVFMFIMLQPWSKLLLFFILPVPAIVAGVGYLIYSSWAANRGHGRLDHSAHFAGAIAGILLIVLLKREILFDFIDRLIMGFPI